MLTTAVALQVEHAIICIIAPSHSYNFLYYEFDVRLNYHLHWSDVKDVSVNAHLTDNIGWMTKLSSNATQQIHVVIHWNIKVKSIAW